jgi:hypothetical protein
MKKMGGERHYKEWWEHTKHKHSQFHNFE